MVESGENTHDTHPWLSQTQSECQDCCPLGSSSYPTNHGPRLRSRFLVAGKRPETPACAAQVRRSPGRARWDTWSKQSRLRAHCVAGKHSGTTARSEPDWAKDTGQVREGRKSAPRRIMPDLRIHCQDTAPLKENSPPGPLHGDWPRVLLLLSLLSPPPSLGKICLPSHSFHHVVFRVASTVVPA